MFIELNVLVKNNDCTNIKIKWLITEYSTFEERKLTSLLLKH